VKFIIPTTLLVKKFEPTFLGEMLNVPIEHYSMQKVINNVQNVIFATRFDYFDFIVHTNK
jgi:hypothetical protein